VVNVYYRFSDQVVRKAISSMIGITPNAFTMTFSRRSLSVRISELGMFLIQLLYLSISVGFSLNDVKSRYPSQSRILGLGICYSGGATGR